MEAYVILGHGTEDVESERQQVPEDTILVTFSECGIAILATEVDKIIDEIVKNPNIAKTPELFPSAIRNKMRIYTPGMEYPTLIISPFVYFDKSNSPDVKIIKKSGVYSTPLPFNDMSVGNVHTTFNNRYFDNTEGIIDKAYEGSLIEPPVGLKQIKELYGNELSKLMLEEPIPISDIFSKLGKGIYYYPSCRYVNDPRELFNKYGYNIKKNIPSNINFKNSLEIKKYLHNYINDNAIKKALKRQIFTIKNIIRPRSAETQSKFKGGKKRRSRTRKYSRKEVM